MPSTQTKSPQRRLQEGQAIVLIALLILVLFGMLGLAIDSGRAYVDRRDQQAAVDAAALAAGDWYENFQNLYGSALPQSKQVFQSDLHLYAGPTSDTITTTFIGPNANLRQDTDVVVYGGGLTLTIVAINTQFNGYQFTFSTNHDLPLAFMQIFGGPLTVTITATATSIVGNQRQTPALLTLSTGSCATNLSGNATLTVVGDTYTNGTACLDPNLREAGNCYGAAGSNCNVAAYYCYNSTPGFIPYPPPCRSGDTQGGPVVPAPSLPDPGYTANPNIYLAAQSYNRYNRGTWTEMYPGQYGSFHLTGGTASCAFLKPGVYVWTAGYQSDASGSLLSNELKAPDEGSSSTPGTTAVAIPQFWNQNSASCAGHFTVTNAAAGQNITLAPPCTDLSPQTPAGCHSGVTDTLGRNNMWGVELTSVRYDTYIDPSVSPNPCYPPASCRRESAPSACQLTPNPVTGSLHSPSNVGVSINITQNAPGAQYYNVYMNPFGCNGQQLNFGWVGRFDAPGFSGGTPVGPYPTGSAWTLGALAPGVPPAAGATLYDLNDRMIPVPSTRCFAQIRTLNCATPDPEIAPQCLQNCPPPPGTMSQENAPMGLQYPPYTGGDVANENYCVVSPNPGDPGAPCATAKVTPGAVQFYLPPGSCLTQNAQGATYVFSGEQYNWIVIYAPGPLQGAPNTCTMTMNGGSATQYIGTIYTPAADWKLTGGNRAPLAGQLIAFTATVSGNATVGIFFNPNYAPAPPAARLIN